MCIFAVAKSWWYCRYCGCRCQCIRSDMDGACALWTDLTEKNKGNDQQNDTDCIQRYYHSQLLHQFL